MSTLYNHMNCSLNLKVCGINYIVKNDSKPEIIMPDWQHSQLYVLRISLNALLMKLVMGQSGLILSDLLRLVSMGGLVQDEGQI